MSSTWMPGVGLGKLWCGRLETGIEGRGQCSKPGSGAGAAAGAGTGAGTGAGAGAGTGAGAADVDGTRRGMVTRTTVR